MAEFKDLLYRKWKSELNYRKAVGSGRMPKEVLEIMYEAPLRNVEARINEYPGVEALKKEEMLFDVYQTSLELVKEGAIDSGILSDCRFCEYCFLKGAKPALSNEEQYDLDYWCRTFNKCVDDLETEGFCLKYDLTSNKDLREEYEDLSASTEDDIKFTEVMLREQEEKINKIRKEKGISNLQKKRI